METRIGIGRPFQGQESNGVFHNVAVSGISVHMSVVFLLPAGLLLGIVFSAGGFSFVRIESGMLW